jgi:tetratricopeptide (TPR) repeat protein
MATGRTPFKDSSQVSVLAKIIETPHEPASSRNAGLPPDLDRILDRCLKKNPAERYQDTQELVEDLRALRRQVESGVSERLSVTQSLPAARGRKMGGWPIRVLLIAAAAVVVVAGLNMLRGENGSVADAGENHLAILGFENKTGDEDLTWMATGLPEILLTDLAQVSDLSLIGRDRVQDVLKKSGKNAGDADHGDWVEASKRMGATKVLSGSYYRLGENIRIDARLQDVSTGEILFADKVVGTNPMELVDSLSAIVIAKLNVTGSAAISVAEMTTASAEAYKYYSQGDEKLMTGLTDEARALYRRALAVDSTFALPYMRIGMSHLFDGRQQEAAGFFAQALRFKEKLSPRDRSLLDIYADVWLKQEFGDAYAKMAAYVEAYPDDKEALSLHGALVITFSADTTQGFALLERALDLDPTYPLALTIYAGHLDRFGHYERAIDLMERMREAYPDAPDSYERLGSSYAALGKYDEALASYDEFRRRFPQDPDVLPSMVNLAIRKRDFEKARGYAAQIAVVKPDDAQWARNREYILSNLDNWEGRFNSALAHYRLGTSYARAMGDTALIHQSLLIQAFYHRRFDQRDSARVYFEKADAYARPIEKMTYPSEIVEDFPERGEEMRPVLRDALNRFRASTPEDLWGLADAVAESFEAFAARDTLRILRYLRGLVERPPTQRSADAERRLGKYLILTGEYEEARDILEGALDTTTAWRYLDTAYWVGRAHEGLGDGKAAAERYQEVLRYWDDADFEIQAIRGAREGLARLRS